MRQLGRITQQELGSTTYLKLHPVLYQVSGVSGNSGSQGARAQRVGVFNFGTDRVRVLEKTSGSGSGTDRVRVLALQFYHSGIIGYRKS